MYIIGTTFYGKFHESSIEFKRLGLGTYII